MSETEKRVWVNPNAVDEFTEGFAVSSSPAGFTDGPLWPEYVSAELADRLADAIEREWPQDIRAALAAYCEARR